MDHGVHGEPASARTLPGAAKPLMSIFGVNKTKANAVRVAALTKAERLRRARLASAII